MNYYEVALWERFRVGDILPHWDIVEAGSPLEAIEKLMKQQKLRRIAHAGVQQVVRDDRGEWVSAGPPERWRMGRGYWVRLSEC